MRWSYVSSPPAADSYCIHLPETSSHREPSEEPVHEMQPSTQTPDTPPTHRYSTRINQVSTTPECNVPFIFKKKKKRENTE